MAIRSFGGEFLSVAGVVATSKSSEAYNFAVADFHTYFAGDSKALVHNCDCTNKGGKYFKSLAKNDKGKLGVVKGVKLTDKGKKKIGNLGELKDTDAAKAILDRGGNAGNVNKALGDNLKGKTVGEIANMAAKGDSAAETALKIIKQAGKKGQKY